MWQSISYKGFDIYVLPILDFGPSRKSTKYSYKGHVCRPSNDIRFVGQVATFSHSFPEFENKMEAWEAGQDEGKTIVDGTHPYITTDHL
ncbi:hypothetical protein [Collimonas sp.]|jgi:hypothetical protein|uniref:hypothetical protein n=1 Tax=Collimonas sp. TaxID=1963772 RepID=UPI002CB16D12|nr:hypothetical protein [Collimonas sp.]HWX01538.1 hypothetical protein [Collimonas sp.]